MFQAFRHALSDVTQLQRGGTLHRVRADSLSRRARSGLRKHRGSTHESDIYEGRQECCRCFTRSQKEGVTRTVQPGVSRPRLRGVLVQRQRRDASGNRAAELQQLTLLLSSFESRRMHVCNCRPTPVDSSLARYLGDLFEGFGDGASPAPKRQTADDAVLDDHLHRQRR